MVVGTTAVAVAGGANNHKSWNSERTTHNNDEKGANNGGLGAETIFFRNEAKEVKRNERMVFARFSWCYW